MPDNLETFKFQNRHGTTYGKPTFPDDLESYDISEYVGPDSPGMFHILHLDPSFLGRPVQSWKTLDSYKNALRAIKSLKVVNDSAERCVKLTGDFLDTARQEERFQNVLQVVENDRSLIPNQRIHHARVAK